MIYKKTNRVTNPLILISALILFSISCSAYAECDVIHSSYFDITLTDKMKLIDKTEEKNNDFHRYVFATSKSDSADMQMRVIVSSRQPEKGQSLEAFQTDALGNMSVMFMDANGLYQYLNTVENQKVLASKPNSITLGEARFAGLTMYFGNTDASFFVTNSHGMTYAFTFISKNRDAKLRKSNLQKLVRQLESMKLKAVSGNK